MPKGKAPEAEFLITDLPEWLGCPFRRDIPSWMTIRRGRGHGQLCLGLEAPEHGKHLVIFASEFPKVAAQLPLEEQIKLALVHAAKYLSASCGQTKGRLN